VAGSRNRKFLLIIVSSIAVLAIVAGTVVALSTISRSESTKPGAAAFTDCGPNHCGTRVETAGECADCMNGAAVDCGSLDNGICPRTGEECTDHIDGDTAVDAVNGECPGPPSP